MPRPDRSTGFGHQPKYSSCGLNQILSGKHYGKSQRRDTRAGRIQRRFPVSVAIAELAITPGAIELALKLIFGLLILTTGILAQLAFTMAVGPEAAAALFMLMQ